MAPDFKLTIKGLWDVEIIDAKSVMLAIEKIAETGKRKDWARKVSVKIRKDIRAFRIFIPESIIVNELKTKDNPAAVMSSWDIKQELI